MKIGALFIILSLTTLAGESQTTPNTINDYKYVLVPLRYDFSKSDDQYALNTTTKSLLEQKGFTVYWINESLPPALAANKCNALVAEVTQRKAMFTTNLTLVLKDCYGNPIFKGKEGRSREKEFYTAYDEALKNAFVSLNAVSYKYDSTLTAQNQTQLQAQQPQSLQTQPLQGQPQQTQPQQTQPQQTQTPPQQAQPPKPQPQQTQPQQSTITGTLYAQPIPNGFQLIDLTPKKVMTLLKTSLPDSYLAQTDAATGVVFKKDGQWLFEYYKEDKLVSQRLDIKF